MKEYLKIWHAARSSMEIVFKRIFPIFEQNNDTIESLVFTLQPWNQGRNARLQP